MPAIPDPVLIGDVLTGSLLEYETGVVLALSTPPPTTSPEHILRPTGSLTVRCALAYLYRPEFIVPGLFASEYGAILVGREAWDYALQHSNLHPRADIIGLRSDGVQDQVMLRELDFGQPVAVFAYESPEARIPLARLTAFWHGDTLPDLPDLIQAHLPRLDTLPAD